jgi:hypothetical protein
LSKKNIDRALRQKIACTSEKAVSWHFLWETGKKTTLRPLGSQHLQLLQIMMSMRDSKRSSKLDMSHHLIPASTMPSFDTHCGVDEKHEEKQTMSKGSELCCGSMKRTVRRWVIIPVAAVTIGLTGYSLVNAQAKEAKRVPDQVSGGRYVIHDLSRPKPPVVTPGTPSTAEKVGTPPSDAVVLFDGKDLSKFKTGNGDAAWKVEDGAMVVSGKGDVQTQRHLHHGQVRGAGARHVRE